MAAQKIAIIGPAHPLRGGLASFNERLATEILHAGHAVKIYTFSLQYPSFLFPGTTQYSNEPAPAHIPIEVCINSVNPLTWIKTGYAILQQQPNVVIIRYWLPFMGPCLGTIARILKKDSSIRVICIADNIIPHETRPGDRLFTKYFVKPIDAFVAMSQQVKKDIPQFSTKPVIKVDHPLYDNFGEAIESETAKSHLRIPANQKIILFFGFIRKYKGLDLLLAAMAILRDQQFLQTHQIKLVIAGEFYESAESYLQQINTLKLNNYIYLHTNFITDSEVKYYLSAADVVVQPYRHATQSGVTPLAYHFNKPMIVTNVGGLPDLVPPQVGMVCAPTADCIAEKIIEFFTSDYSIYRHQIEQEKKKYSWSVLLENILSLSL